MVTEVDIGDHLLALFTLHKEHSQIPKPKTQLEIDTMYIDVEPVLLI